MKRAKLKAHSAFDSGDRGCGDENRGGYNDTVKFNKMGAGGVRVLLQLLGAALLPFAVRKVCLSKTKQQS